MSTMCYHPAESLPLGDSVQELPITMISSICIQGYRGFNRFEMSELGRLNLLVGTNNSGKTSVLEALHLLTSRGDPMSLWQLLWRRGERVSGSMNQRQPQAELDVSHLFTGHETHVGSEFTLSAKNQTPERTVTFSIAELTKRDRQQLLDTEGGAIPSRLVLHIKGNPAPPVETIPLTRSGGILPDALDAPPRRRRHRRSEENSSLFIATESLDSDDLVSFWDKIALTSDEEIVLQALRLLHPGIERIAAQAAMQYYGGHFRGGFIVKLKDHDQPIPIGSMGDGMWRMLSMAIAITQCKGGVFLVDEIDTGLHYTVMSDMWKLIFEASKALDVQVFATTHSFDCIETLANICVGGDLFSGNAVTLQRIETGRPKAVPYTEKEIRVASERGVEVR